MHFETEGDVAGCLVLFLIGVAVTITASTCSMLREMLNAPCMRKQNREV